MPETKAEWQRWERQIRNAVAIMERLSPADIKYVAARALGVVWVEPIRTERGLAPKVET